MALRTRHRRVEASQRERGCVVVEARWHPSSRRVAERAISGEAGSNVVRARRPRKVCLVAGVAIGRRRGIAVVSVALRARHRCMLARQRPVRIQGMIEYRVIPIGGVMARSAIVRQAKLHVWRVVAVGEVRRVARITLRRSPCKHVIDMACRALQRRVRARKRVTRVLQVVELGAHKVVQRVARLARGGEVKCDVVDDRRQEVLLMARVAGRR